MRQGVQAGRARRFVSVTAVVGASLLIAACGGGDDDDAGGGAASATDTPTAEADTAGTEDTVVGEGGGEAAEQVLRMAWGAEPPSLDPGLATDTTSSNVLFNIMDPLVKLDDNLEPQPSLAESFEQTGTTVTYKLRTDGRWTNGDPVTAKDFEYSWKRTLDPELGADYSYQLYGIKGAEEYNTCEKNCAKLRDAVAVKAVDDTTLQVELTSAQPWFLGQSAHHAFMAVHQPTVEKFKEKWTEPANIVTNGPFKLTEWEHEASITLEKNDQWRDAANVKLTRVEGRIIVDGTTRVAAFEAGEVDALDGGGLPPADIPRLKETPEYENYPALGTYMYEFNTKNIPDVNQRKAMSMAIDRRTIIDKIAQADQIPATSMSPKGIPGFDEIKQDYIKETADIEGAKALMAQAQNPKTEINLILNNSPGHKEIATAIQSMWQPLGIKVSIKQQEWAQFLEFIGPPADPSVDVNRYGWIGDFPDAINFLELWTCKGGNNHSGYCDPEYDALVKQARSTEGEEERFALYKEMEQMLFSEENGAFPVMPIYWYTYVNLERETIKDTFNINLLDQFDLTKVVVKEG